MEHPWYTESKVYTVGYCYKTLWNATVIVCFDVSRVAAIFSHFVDILLV